jgi:hypothetical protein
MDLRRGPDLGRRPLLRTGVDDPVGVVQVELRPVLEQGEVGLPVGLDRADVLPVAVVAVAEDAGAAVEHRRDDVAAEVRQVLAQPAPERPLREDVDAHRGKVALGLLRLLLPLDDAVGVVHAEDAHPAGVGERHAPDRDGHVRPVAPVRLDERLVVHLVDVVAGEDDDGVGGRALDDVHGPEDGVGRPAVPLGDAAARDVRLEELHAAPVPVEVPRPPEPDVVVQGVRVVLGKDEDVIDVRVDAVRQAEVDDPVLATERDGRLRTHGRQDREAFAFTTGEDERHRPLHSRAPPGSWPLDGNRSTGPREPRSRRVNGRSTSRVRRPNAAGEDQRPRGTGAG